MGRSRYARRGRGFGSGAPFWLGGLTLMIAIAAGCDDGPVSGPADPSLGTTIPAATGCTNPKHSGPQPTRGLEPRQLAAAYGIDKLWDAGFRGQGMRVALIEPGERLDVGHFLRFSDCWGPFPVPNEIVVDGGTPPVLGGEPNFDSETLLTVAPELEGIYLFETAKRGNDQIGRLLAAALDPAHTGGELVDAISSSFSTCEAAWSPAALDSVNAQLRRAAELGVKVFVAGGDSGSAGSFFDPETKEVKCVKHPVPPDPPPGVALAVTFPASSPWATAVGGTELAIDGRIPQRGSREGGAVTNEVVWNQELPAGQEFPGGRLAGGGGQSEIFSMAAATWQQQLGLDGMFNRPDVSALAGSPRYPGGGVGTSGAAPMTAGGIMVVDSYLAGHGVEPPGFLNPILYELARTDYERVFRDVVIGDNDVYHLGCCYAEPGYDTASGLGSIRFDELAAVLLERGGGR